MARLTLLSACLLVEAVWSQPADAQMSAPPIRSALPSLSSMSLNNAAGVLKYCERNRLVSVAGTDTVLESLAAKPNAMSTDYVAGQGGQIIGDHGKTLSLPKAPGYMQSQACDQVLRRAKQFGVRR